MVHTKVGSCQGSRNVNTQDEEFMERAFVLSTRCNCLKTQYIKNEHAQHRTLLEKLQCLRGKISAQWVELLQVLLSFAKKLHSVCA